jgi:hypothetical protein
MEKFSLKKQKEVDCKKTILYCSNKFAALEDFDSEVSTNSAWETFRENTTISVKEGLGYYELYNICYG